MVVPNQSFLSQSNSYDLKPLVEKLCSNFHLFEPSKKFLKHVSCKTRNHPESSQTTHKPVKPHTNQPNHTQTSHNPGKPPTSQSQTRQTTHKPAKYWTNHPQTSQLWAENQFFMLPKTLVTMQNICYVCNHLTPLY